MSTASQLLEKYKTEELAAKLEADGFTVRRGARVAGLRYDLVAKRGTDTRAYEVVVAPVDSERLSQMRHRRTAWASGPGRGRFHTVVAWPPKQVKVEIDGFVDKLLRALRETPPPALAALQPRSLEAFDEIDVDIVSVTPDGTRLQGRGVISIDGTMADPDAYFGCPFSCTAHLDHDLNVTEIEEFALLTSEG